METRRIVLDGEPADVVRDGEDLVAEDGRRLPADEAVHLPPVQPTKIVCVHLNDPAFRAYYDAQYRRRV